MRTRFGQRSRHVLLAAPAAVIALVIAGSSLLAPAAPSTSAHRAGAGIVLSTAPATAPPDGQPYTHLPAGAASAARVFVRDYLAALTDPASAAHVRFATDDLRQRIAAAGVHLGRPDSHVVIPALTIDARGRDLVAVRVAATVAGVRQHIAFVMARVHSGWRVADIDDPEGP